MKPSPMSKHKLTLVFLLIFTFRKSTIGKDAQIKSMTMEKAVERP